MIEINKYELKNGLRLIHSCDPTIQMATVNTLYDVGAKKETPGKTGLAHLMEHLMFAGSRNVKNINEHIRRAGECVCHHASPFVDLLRQPALTAVSALTSKTSMTTNPQNRRPRQREVIL